MSKSTSFDASLPGNAVAALDVDGTEVFIDGEGRETIVMVHGWPDTWRLWDHQVDVLQAQFRCVRFTVPGFDTRQPARGRSLTELVECIARVADATSPDRPVILMLHDWGCLFGYQFYMRYPARVSRIIGVDIGDAGSPDHARSLTATQKARVFAYQAWLATAWRLRASAGDRMTRWMARKLHARSDPEFIGAQMNYPYDIQWTGSFGSYREALPFEPACPMLFIYGERKPFHFHSPQWAARLSRKPGSRVTGLRTGHWVMRHDVPGFNAAVTDWLGSDRDGATDR